MQGLQFWSLVRELDPICLKAKNQKTENGSNIVTNSIKTLKKNGPHRKKKSLKKNVENVQVSHKPASF